MFNANVSKLIIYNQYIYYQFPKSIEKFFPNLSRVDFFDGSLITITSKDLQPFPNLTSLSLSRQKIIILDGDLFKYTLKLEYINLSENAIQHIGKDFLKSLTKLTVFDFFSNTCYSYVAYNSTQLEMLKAGLEKNCPAI